MPNPTQAQGEYTSSLEEEVQGLNSDIATLKEVPSMGFCLSLLSYFQRT